jgi:hypothetical protein
MGFSVGTVRTVLPCTPVVVRKNSIKLPSDRDAGTYLFGFPALGSPKNQSCEQKMLLSRADPVQSGQAMFRFFQNTKRSLDSLLNLITDLVADGLRFFQTVRKGVDDTNELGLSSYRKKHRKPVKYGCRYREGREPVGNSNRQRSL